MRKLLVVLLFLIGVVAVVADVALRGVAEGVISERMAQQLDMTENPEVAIEGWAFLPQAVTGEYSRITITGDGAAMAGVSVEQIEANATDVDAPLGDLLEQPSVVAGTIDGSFVVPYSYFNAHLPEGMTVTTEGGQPRIVGELALPELSLSTSVSAGAEFTVEGDTVRLTPVDVQLGDTPIDVSSMVQGMLSFSVQAPALPFGLTVTDMEATSNGLRITGVGQDVPLMGAEAA
ncbi:hypothetical protein BJF83_16485 [Nocardiopsis sp. CNR-923]|uniref:LmeA family phospholipid-binding protein n=1 Tax=Nocardiopsis sp. CNR-923 TaxID=1904965 RepID=UPI00095B727E|nr:DUF2993 domain-containing protein [Nocardiopsis sp. CNR-923]OLT28038.1 hypothetical protein BJF83_16485 [Nocardiopsis sp. CNR-923]